MAVRLILVLAFALGGGLALGEEFSPADLEGLVAWYDARSLYGEHIKLRDGESVEVWPDRSGNGHDLQADPKGGLAAFRTKKLNDLPLVQLREAASFLVTNPFNLKDHTIVLVHDTTLKTRALFSSDTNAQLGVVLNANDGRHQIRQGLKSWDYNKEQPESGFSVTALSRDAGVLRSVVNGIGSTGSQTKETLRVGRMFRIHLSRAVSRDAKGMSVAELLFFDRRLGQEELAALTGHLAIRYGLEQDRLQGDARGPESEEFDWSRAKVLASLSSTFKGNLNVEDGRAIDWNVPSQAGVPLRHDPKGAPSRLYCTQDMTRVRLKVNLSLRASEPGTELTVLVLKNHERYLEHIGVTEATSSGTGEERLSARYEVPLTLSAGDYIEVVVARNGAAGTVSMVPPDNFLIVAAD